jgi:dsDNA-specific endonuclease/ATPase MutS2
MEDDDDTPDPNEPFVVPIEREIDLHTFQPKDVGNVVRDWLDACVELGFDEVRIIHGKGIGNLRRTVHSVLDRHPAVASHCLAQGDRGGWGATVVQLRKGRT